MTCCVIHAKFTQRRYNGVCPSTITLFVSHLSTFVYVHLCCKKQQNWDKGVHASHGPYKGQIAGAINWRHIRPHHFTHTQCGWIALHLRVWPRIPPGASALTMTPSSCTGSGASVWVPPYHTCGVEIDRQYRHTWPKLSVESIESRLQPTLCCCERDGVYREQLLQQTLHPMWPQPYWLQVPCWDHCGPMEVRKLSVWDATCADAFATSYLSTKCYWWGRSCGSLSCRKKV